MTDNDIIQVLEKNLKLMLYDGDLQRASTISEAIALINRQKAEIERLTINMNAFCLGMKREAEKASNARAEAITEFAARLKKRYEFHIICDWRTLNGEIDDLVKEMLGDSDDENALG